MNRHVNITKRIKTPNGLRFCPVVVSANGRVKPDHVLLADREERRLEAPNPWNGDRGSAQSVIAEIGPSLDTFPSHGHLCSWAKVWPGNNESAGKHKSGSTGHGNRWLESMLVQVAWAASHKKGSYFQAQYRRLAGRRGKKRAIVAVAQSILTDTFYILKQGRTYKDLVGDYFDRLSRDRIRRYHVKRVQDLGYKVELAEQAVA